MSASFWVYQVPRSTEAPALGSSAQISRAGDVPPLGIGVSVDTPKPEMFRYTCGPLMVTSGRVSAVGANTLTSLKSPTNRWVPSEATESGAIGTPGTEPSKPTVDARHSSLLQSPTP